MEESRIYYYPPDDLAFSFMRERSVDRVKNLEAQNRLSGPPLDLNEALENYNIYRYLTALRADIREQFEKQAVEMNRQVHLYFQRITTEEIAKNYLQIDVNYRLDFWRLYAETGRFAKEDSDWVLKILRDSPESLQFILEQKKLVQAWNEMLTSYMRTSDEAAQLLIHYNFGSGEDFNSPKEKIILPSSLTSQMQSQMVKNFIESGKAGLDDLHLVVFAPKIKKCNIDDETRYLANNLYEDKEKQAFSGGLQFTIEASCKVDNMPLNEGSRLEMEGTKASVVLNREWIRQNQDRPTLLNNLIYMLRLVGRQGRSVLPAHQSQMGIFERFAGVKATSEYINGGAFKLVNMLALVELITYAHELERIKVPLESLIQYFFETYIPNEFGIQGFTFIALSSNVPDTARIRNLFGELDKVMRQYDMLATRGEINQGLLEISSNSISYKEVHSLLEHKYMYINSRDLRSEIGLLCSNQSGLFWLSNHKHESHNLLQFLAKENVRPEEYTGWNKPKIQFLYQRGAIFVGQDGYLKLNPSRCLICEDLYLNDVLCPLHMIHDSFELTKMVDAGDLVEKDTLLSEPEQDYMSFIMNHEKFSNSLDLRNRYIHGANTLDAKTQRDDYYRVLLLVITVILKMNEELCLKYPESPER